MTNSTVRSRAVASAFFFRFLVLLPLSLQAANAAAHQRVSSNSAAVPVVVPAKPTEATSVSLDVRQAERTGSFEMIERDGIGSMAIQRADISSRLEWRIPPTLTPGWYQASFLATSRYQAIAERLDENEPFRLTAIHAGDSGVVRCDAFAFKVAGSPVIALAGLPAPLLDPTPLQTWRGSKPLWIGRDALVRLEVRRPLLIVGDVRLRPVAPDACVGLTLEGDAPYNMFSDADAVRFRYELRNLADAAFKGALCVILTDVVDGTEDVQRVDLAISGDGVASGDLEWRPKFGAYQLTVATENSEGDVQYAEHRHLTYGPSIDAKTLPDRWPVAFHRSPSEPDLIPPIGAKWVRVWGGWGQMEPEPGRYDWEQMDRNVAMASRHGYRLLWVCHGVPGWSLPVEHRFKSRAGAHYAPADIERIRPFLRDFWARYASSGVFGAVEIGNEPNAHPGWSPAQYAQMARAVYEETHRLAGGVRVVGISMSGGLHIRYMEEALDAGLDTNMDVASLHVYEIGNPTGERSVDTKVRAFVQTLRARGLQHLPIWNTESGAPTDIRQDGRIVPQEELNRQIRQHPDFNARLAWRVKDAWRGASEVLGAAWCVRASYQQFAMGVEKNFMFAWSGSPHFSWVHDYRPGGNPMPKLPVVATAVMSKMLREFGPEPAPEQPIIGPAGDHLIFAHRFAGPRGRMTIVYVHPSDVHAGSGDRVAALASGDDQPISSVNESSPWLRLQMPAPVRVSVPVRGSQVLVMDILGRECGFLEVVNGTVTLTATEIPQYVLESNEAGERASGCSVPSGSRFVHRPRGTATPAVVPR